MNIIRNIIWIFGANLISSFTKWLIIVIIARIMTPAEVGAYSLAFAVGAPITLFANMKIRSLFVTEEHKNFNDYLYSRILLSLFATFILIIISIFIYPHFAQIILLVGLIKILDLQSDMYYALPHKEGDMDIIGKLMTFKHIFTLVVFFIFILFFRNLTISLAAQLIAQLLFLYFIEIRMIRKNYIVSDNKFNFTNVKAIIFIGLPLGFVQMMTSFNSSYPRYLLEYFESAEVLGYFSAIIYILIIGNMMMNAVSQNFLPLLSKKLRNNEYDSFKKYVFINLTIFALSLGGILFLGSYFLGEIFLTIIYGEDYAQYSDILVLMSIALAINIVSWNFDTALMAMRYISVQPKILSTVLTVNLIFGYIFIKAYGIYGATISIIISNCFQLVLRATFVIIRINSLSKTT